MKKYFSIIKVFIIALFGVLASCVHDDNYAAPDLNQCQDEAYFTNPENKFVNDLVLAILSELERKSTKK